MFLQLSVCSQGGWGGGAIPACIAGGIPACLAAGLQVGWYPSMPYRFPGPHPRGKFRGSGQGGLQAHTWGGEGEGDLVQAHTQGGSWGGSGWGCACLGGCLLWGCLLWGVSAPGVSALGGAWSRGEGCGDPPWWLLLRAVRILLECILVF